MFACWAASRPPLGCRYVITTITVLVVLVVVIGERVFLLRAREKAGRNKNAEGSPLGAVGTLSALSPTLCLALAPICLSARCVSVQSS